MKTSTGILLINLGTPNAPDVASVKRYLREFLTDPKVIDLPNPWRSLLVNGLIIPLRAKKSAHAYQQVWTKAGSPLMVNSLALLQSVQDVLGPDYLVRLAMNYGQPSIEHALNELKACEKIIVLPLFPQYSSAVTESILEKVQSFVSLRAQRGNTGLGVNLNTEPGLPRCARNDKAPVRNDKATAHNDKAKIQIIKDFYNHPAFIEAMAAQIQNTLDTLKPEYLLLSYHGLPMRQLYKTSGDICKNCTTSACPIIQEKNRYCYRAQCYETSRLIIDQLSLGDTKVITTFQSRLGRLTWTQPYTEQVLSDLAQQGIKDIAIACPSFVTDCLETLEEIGIRGQATWKSLNGNTCTLIPTLNGNGFWLCKILSAYL